MKGKKLELVFVISRKRLTGSYIQDCSIHLQLSWISRILLNWFEHYLSDRKQRVVLPGANSMWVPIKAGVPQGSILGPLLFLVFINDIVNDLGATVRLFADDTSLYIIVENPQTASTILNDDLNKIHSWAQSWLVTFNPAKTETLLLSRKRNTNNHPTLYMNRTPIKEVTTHSIWVYISPKLETGKHTQTILELKQ